MVSSQIALGLEVILFPAHNDCGLGTRLDLDWIWQLLAKKKVLGWHSQIRSEVTS